MQAKPAGWNEQQSGWSAMKPRQPGAGGWGEANEWAAKVHICFFFALQLTVVCSLVVA